MKHVQRVRPGTVISILALFLALGGTGYAALKLPHNSVTSKTIKNHQVKNADLAKNAVDSSIVKDGSLLAADFGAGQLPRGAAGPQGPKGDIGPQGPKGDTGAQGDPGPLLDTLPSGRTLKGTFGFAGTRNGSGFIPVVPISYQIPLATAPTVEIRQSGSSATAGCPGTSAAPTATAGTMCIYVNTAFGTSPITLSSQSSGAPTLGVSVFPSGVNSGDNYEIYGSWAVTAP